ncbi:MAG: DinB family protein [Janthinobacterium lividum]
MGDGAGADNGRRGGVTEAAARGDERTTLTGVLQRQRDLVVWKLQDSADDALRSVATGSGMRPHGVVRHLTNVERSWLRDIFAGEAGVAFDWTEDDPDGDWDVPAQVTMAQLLTDYVEESHRCDDVVATTESLDVVSARRGVSLRWVLLHLIEETARHLGHLDLLREQVDGSTGEEPV